MPTPVAQKAAAMSIYDAMMEVIHPDLVQARVQVALMRKDGESEQEYEERMQEYAAAFFVMSEALKDLQNEEACEIALQKAKAMKDEQAKASEEDTQSLRSIEQQFSK